MFFFIVHCHVHVESQLHSRIKIFIYQPRHLTYYWAVSQLNFIDQFALINEFCFNFQAWS
jgi:hypothetical protein